MRNTIKFILAFILAFSVVAGLRTPQWAAASSDAHQTQCYKHGADANGWSQNDHGKSSQNWVMLNTFNQSWFGDHWESLTIGTVTITHPVAGQKYYTADQKKVRTWAVCKGETPPTTTTSTTTSTTTTTTTTTTSVPDSVPPTTIEEVTTTSEVTTTAPQTTLPDQTTTEPSVSVVDPPVTTVAAVAPDQALPKTGTSLGLFVLAIVFVGLGWVAISAARRP